LEGSLTKPLSPALLFPNAGGVEDQPWSAGKGFGSYYREPSLLDKLVHPLPAKSENRSSLANRPTSRPLHRGEGY
jgi:hypothetical protein